MYKAIDIVPVNELLFFLILLPFCVHLDGCLVLNCLWLVHFHLLDIIGPLF